MFQVLVEAAPPPIGGRSEVSGGRDEEEETKKPGLDATQPADEDILKALWSGQTVFQPWTNCN